MLMISRYFYEKKYLKPNIFVLTRSISAPNFIKISMILANDFFFLTFFSNVKTVEVQYLKNYGSERVFENFHPPNTHQTPPAGDLEIVFPRPNCNFFKSIMTT